MAGPSELEVQDITLTGLEPTYEAANEEGNYFPSDGRVFLAIQNNGVDDDITITIDSQIKCDQGYDHDLAILVESGSTIFIGPFSRRFCGEDNAVHVAYSAFTEEVTDLKVAAIRLP